MMNSNIVIAIMGFSIIAAWIIVPVLPIIIVIKGGSR